MAYRLERTQSVSTPRFEVTAFFEDPKNLQELTPPFLNFEILTSGELEMNVGARIDYRISLHGVGMKWKTRIEEYVPGERFVDLQISGPYEYWHHLHTFEDMPGGTKLMDVVDYVLPFGPVGSMAHALFVRRQLKAIFDYRYQVIQQKFGTLRS